MGKEMTKKLAAAVITILVITTGTGLALASPGISIVPGSVAMQTGTAWTFKVITHGSETRANLASAGCVYWSIDPTAGTVDRSGVFHAGNTPGVYYLYAITGEGEALAEVRILPLDPGSGYKPSCWWGGDPPGRFNGFRRVTNTALDSLGSVYVVDQVNNRIQKFDSSGNFILAWGCRGSRNGQFSEPHGITVDSADNIYVSERRNHRIQKFDSSGKFLMAIGSSGEHSQRVTDPTGVAVDSHGNVYVVCSFNHQIMKFDPSGKLITAWGSYGEGNGQFEGPNSIAIDSLDNLYISDYANNRVQKFDSSGNFLAAWGSSCGKSTDGILQMNSPQGIDVDASGKVYVADTYNYRIGKYDPQGNFIDAWRCEAVEMPNYSAPDSIAVDDSGRMYIVDGCGHRIVKLDAAGNHITAWGELDHRSDEHFTPIDIAISPSGNLHMLDRDGGCVWEFDLSGNFTTVWKLHDERTDALSMCIGSSGCVYVADGSNSRIEKYDSQGNFIKEWSLPCSVSHVAVDAEENIYASGINVLKFDSSGRFITALGSPGTDNGHLGMPEGVVVENNGSIYVADSCNDLIHKFSPGNPFATAWEPYCRQPFSWPTDITMDQSRYMFIADTNNNRVCKIDNKGRLVAVLGKNEQYEDLFEPRGVVVDDCGNVYVADTGNGRIVKYTPFSRALWELPIDRYAHGPVDLSFFLNLMNMPVSQSE